MANQEYRDFEIWIHGTEPPDAVEVGVLEKDRPYQVSVNASPEDRRAEGTFRSPYAGGEMERALQWMEQGLVDEADAKEFGSTLFGALFRAEVGSVYEASLRDPGPAVRVRMVIDVPVLTTIPWELLYDPARRSFVALDAPFVRGASFTEPTRSLVTDPPLRVLVVTAFPSRGARH